jgi:Ca2+-transporting ATPase
MNQNTYKINGLSKDEVLESRKKFGENKIEEKKKNLLSQSIAEIVKEPMVLILLVAAILYFSSGKYGDGIFLSSAIVLISTISFYQNSRSKNALEKLKKYTQTFCKVIRDKEILSLKSEDLVVGDFLIVEEGSLISADAKIIQSNDFSVNEAILTGESFSIIKNKDSKENQIFHGTLVEKGMAIAEISAIGQNTKLGRIGKSLEDIIEEKTPLELQIKSFVTKMILAGAIVFLVVWLINFLQSHIFLNSLLKSLTLAMSILPEEIPVAFATFMALGAWRLIKLGIVVKQMKTVETLGSATVICTDKTGTITENKMSLAKFYVFKTHSFSDLKYELSKDEAELLSLSMWSSEVLPFDPMENAIHTFYTERTKTDERPNFKMIHEYPLDGKPPMMTHVFRGKNGHKIIAAKGAPEALMEVSNLDEKQKKQIQEAIHNLALEGFRVLGVGESLFEGDTFPKTQQELKFNFVGLIAFYDPPKKNIQAVFENFYKAGISVKIITGDNAETTISIAKQIGFVGFDKSINGDKLMLLNDKDLQKTVMETTIFTRMFPEAKLRIINALKAQKQIVAMTGDGVNDGPALKSAHIGIAMGKRGSAVAKNAASLILIDDDLAKMVDAVATGRKIYANLKKAISYIISIHIPIILTVFIPLALGWIYPSIFSPIHVIFLEIIMGPTCSIIYENEPMEKNAMNIKPRTFTKTFFNWNELIISIVQGFIISLGTLFIYQYAVQNSYNESLTRTMVFTTLIFSNIFLTLVNRSFYYSIITTLKYKNNLVLIIIFITCLILALFLLIKPMRTFFEFESISLLQLFLCIGVGFISVMWFELYKLILRRKS